MPNHTIRRAISRLFSKRNEQEPLPEPTDAALLEEVKGYGAIIGTHIPFFNKLSIEDKQRFLARVYHFKASKNFYYQGMAENPDIPVLISAAAVQLTFGLEKYKLTYFKDFYVLHDAYAIPEYPGLYIGHVAPKGVYISWKHFLEGYKNDQDNVNVAIHELAHALEYENFLSGINIDWDFRKADLPAWICLHKHAGVLGGNSGSVF